MWIWHLTWDSGEQQDDLFRSAIVVAENAEKAAATHPLGGDPGLVDSNGWVDTEQWAARPDLVTVKLLGMADTDVPAGVVLTDFVPACF